MSVAFLCPGQGAQRRGFLHALVSHPEKERTLAEANELLGEDVLALDSPRALESTAAVQLAVVTAGVATARVLQALRAEPDYVAGMSVGAFTAAVVCGALEFRDALELVRVRAQLMAAAYPRGYGLGAVSGLSESVVRELVRQTHASGSAVFLANLNGPTQFVIAGSDIGISSCFARALEAGARSAARLEVSVPSHCELLAGVARELALRIAPVRMERARIPYVANVSARPTCDAEVIRNDLASNVMHPVRWHDATRVIFELGTRVFLELPPGRALSDLAAAAFPEARAMAVADSSIASAIHLIGLERHKE